ncbi:hypothetical protein ACFO0N_00870 [Halobium salinum]|uniref:DUF8027 domain-containing protein n=1 Tax=Halobium salinum TaxID=1364940 RepID=A0ABD5P7N7_9EURY|nr:hypothetical protein [Halobium salinum]
MPIPGYDPDDVDDHLEGLLDGEDLDEYLSADERRRYEDGESLGDLLDEEDIRRLLDEDSESETAA